MGFWNGNVELRARLGLGLGPILIFSCILLILNPAPVVLGNHFHQGHRFLRNRERLLTLSLSDVNTYWFNQTLDHFDPSDSREWKQRYFINDTFYKPGGPIFLQIGGEGEANPIWMSNGAWIEYAEKLGAYCIQLEHRYYGKSHPTPDISLNNLKYLTSEQALADLATFTAAMKLSKFPTNKWVAFGGSYPGSLAAWYRLKYPHLVDISVSSSAPLVAQLNFKEYLGVVSAAINRTNAGCASVIQQAVHDIEGLLKRRTGWQMIQKTFQLCDTFTGDNRKDVSNLFQTLAGNFMDIVQYNEDNRGFEGSKTANITIETLCNIMTQKGVVISNATTKLSSSGSGSASGSGSSAAGVRDKSPMERYSEVNTLLRNALNETCTDFKYSKMVKSMQESEWNSSCSDGARQWTYQTCTEFGFYQSSDLEGQPFGPDFPVDFTARECRDVYGSKYDQDFIEKSILWTNANYGGKGLKVTRVIFVNGSIDPWHALGLTAQNETSSDNLVIFIDGTAHCANMYPSSEKDLQQLKDARAQVLQQITTWLQKS